MLISEQDLPLGVDAAVALRSPDFCQVGQFVVPGDLPHVGRGRDSFRDQGSCGNRPTVPGIKRSNGKVSRDTNLLIDLLDELVLVGFTQTMINDVAL